MIGLQGQLYRNMVPFYCCRSLELYQNFVRHLHNSRFLLLKYLHKGTYCRYRICLIWIVSELLDNLVMLSRMKDLALFVKRGINLDFAKTEMSISSIAIYHWDENTGKMMFQDICQVCNSCFKFPLHQKYDLLIVNKPPNLHKK